MKICLACSSGGHLSEMMELKEVYGRYNHFFVTYRSADTIELAEKEKVHFLVNPRRHPILTILNILQSFKRFIKEKPDIVLTTGAGVALPMCYIAKLYRKKIIFIESFCRVEKPSLFGKLIYPIANLTLVQWEPLLEYYKRAEYGGYIFDFSSKEDEEQVIKNQIFVAVGTFRLGFDRLLKEVDRLMEEGIIKEKLIAQIGHTQYTPKNYKWFKFLAGSAYEDLLRKSGLIITHDGAGTIAKAMKYKKSLIIVPRLQRYGEVAYDNKFELAKELEERFGIPIVEEMPDLEKALEKSKIVKYRLLSSNEKMIGIIQEELNKMEKCGKKV